MAIKEITYPIVKSCLLQRIPTVDFFSSKTLSNELAEWGIQEKIFDVIKPIVELNPYYVKLFVNRYISFIESNNEEVIESIYELYCSEKVLNAVERDATSTDIVKYWIGGLDTEQNDEDVVAIKEQPNLISGSGTTGLRTWEAALYLSNYLNGPKCPIDLKGKLICELGTGTGLVSLALTKHGHQLKKIVMTDGNTSLIDNLNDSFKLNGVNEENKIETCQLLWGTTNPKDADLFTQLCPEVDMVIAADVTYDSSVLSQLCSTINDFFQSGSSMALIASTVRNQATNNSWEAELEKWFPNWSIIDTCQTPSEVSGNCWFKNGTPPIKVYRILRA